MSADRWADTLDTAVSHEPIFGYADSAAFRELGSKLPVTTLLGGQILFRQGDAADASYAVLSGRLLVLREARDGPVVVGAVARGEVVGEMALLSGERRSATVVAARDCELIKISKADFAEFSSSDHHFTVEIARMLVRRLAAMVGGGCQPVQNTRTVAIAPISSDVDVNLLGSKIADGLRAHGKTMIVDRTVAADALGDEVFAAAGADNRNNKLVSWLNQREFEADYVIYIADHHASGWAQQCVRQADRLLLVASAQGSPIPDASEGEFCSALSAKDLAPPELLLIQRDDVVLPRNTDRWLKLRRVGRHHHARLGVPRDFERLARRLAGRGRGLVLGGGGAKGFAHIGVARGLEEAKIDIDHVGGSSMGAVIASVIAKGMNHREITSLCRHMFVRSNPANDYRLPLIGLVAGRKADRALMRCFGEAGLEDLWLPAFCVSTNITRSRLEVDERGPIWLALRASTSIPGVFPPVIRSGDVLVDGGVMNNLPLDIMRTKDVARLIGVEVASNTGTAAPEWSEPTLNGWAVFLNRYLKLGRKRVPTILEVLWAAATVGSDSSTNRVRDQADLLIRPQLDHFGTFDWRPIDAIIDVGYRAAQKALEEIRWQ